MHVHYEIHVQGFLGPALRAAFADLRCRAVAGNSAIRGRMSLEQLHNVLARLDRCGVELVEVRCQDGGAPEAPPREAGTVPDRAGTRQVVTRPG